MSAKRAPFDASEEFARLVDWLSQRRSEGRAGLPPLLPLVPTDPPARHLRPSDDGALGPVSRPSERHFASIKMLIFGLACIVVFTPCVLFIAAAYFRSTTPSHLLRAGPPGDRGQVADTPSFWRPLSTSTTPSSLTAAFSNDPRSLPSAAMSADPLSFDPTALLLFDRHLSEAEKAAELAPDLLEAILRIEGIYDPTLLDGVRIRSQIWPGTAFLDNVFADHWQFDVFDPNVHLNVSYIAQSWQRFGNEPCDSFFKHRPSLEIVELTTMSALDCDTLAMMANPPTERSLQYLAPAVAPLPVFAAPWPGGRMSPAARVQLTTRRNAAIRFKTWFERSFLRDKSALNALRPGPAG